mmetsp:Transcript_21455/g.49980  ORF Transcript_21455/g.49980 Transcript_21455/m.49980 type:complete len:216 (-) Transcript_21455:222-869(-)
MWRHTQLNHLGGRCGGRWLWSWHVLLSVLRLCGLLDLFSRWRRRGRLRLQLRFCHLLDESTGHQDNLFWHQGLWVEKRHMRIFLPQLADAQPGIDPLRTRFWNPRFLGIVQESWMQPDLQGSSRAEDLLLLHEALRLEEVQLLGHSVDGRAAFGKRRAVLLPLELKLDLLEVVRGDFFEDRVRDGRRILYAKLLQANLLHKVRTTSDEVALEGPY